jgi:hypothetical protein
MIRDGAEEEARTSLASPRHGGATQRAARRAKHIHYTFMGKLTLIPVGVLFFGSGMGFLVFHSCVERKKKKKKKKKNDFFLKRFFFFFFSFFSVIIMENSLCRRFLFSGR